MINAARLDIADPELDRQTRIALEKIGVRILERGMSNQTRVIFFRDVRKDQVSYEDERPCIYVWAKGRIPGNDQTENPFEDLMARHWIGASPVMDCDTLYSTIEGITVERAPAFEALLGESAVIDKAVETSSDTKSAHEQRLQAFCEARGVPATLHGPMIAAFDELFSNAVYNAPTSEDRRHTNLFTDRRIAVHSEQPITIQFGASATYVGIAVRDEYGSLPVVRVLESLARGFRSGGAAFEDKQGGAGLGLFMLLLSATRLVIAIDPGRSCQFIFLRRINERRHQFALTSPTLNLFAP